MLLRIANSVLPYLSSHRPSISNCKSRMLLKLGQSLIEYMPRGTGYGLSLLHNFRQPA